jgi:hypothetical protein
LNDLRAVQVFKPNHKQEKKGIKMKKLFIVTVMASLMIFIAGFASAASKTPPPVCTVTECSESGSLYFVAVDGATVTKVEDVTLTLTRVKSGVFWTGKLVFPSDSALFPSTTMNISAIKAPDQADDPHLFRDIAGVDSTTGEVKLQAEGRTNAIGTNASGKSEYGFGFHGTIHSDTFTGSFHGPLFPTQ